MPRLSQAPQPPIYRKRVGRTPPLLVSKVLTENMSAAEEYCYIYEIDIRDWIFGEPAEFVAGCQLKFGLQVQEAQHKASAHISR